MMHESARERRNQGNSERPNKPKPSIAEIALADFGLELGGRLLRAGAIHPINDRRNRKACYIKGYHLGFHDIGTTDYVAVGFQAGQLSGMQLLDIDAKSLIPSELTPNVDTARGAHFYGRWRGGSPGQVKIHPKVDFIRHGNAVFHDDLTKQFLHAELLPDEVFDDLLSRFAELKRHEQNRKAS